MVEVMVFDSTAQRHNRRRYHEKGKLSILEPTARTGCGGQRWRERYVFTREDFNREINAMTKDCETQSQNIYLASLVF